MSPTRRTTALDRTRSATLLAALAIVATGCAGVQHIDEYQPKKRDYQSPVELVETRSETPNGSLFSRTHQGAFFFQDQRAMRIGDLVTVNVTEDANAERDAMTDLTRDAGVSLDITKFLGLVQLLGNAVAQGGQLINAGQTSDFYGKGQTSRTEHVRATVPAMVMKVLPNGNLFIEGHRVILVNDEEHHFYVSGLARPLDILEDNSIDSSRIADLQMEFTGRGVITEKQHPGWLQRGLDIIAPF